MELLKQRIMQDGRCYPGGILKVDSFINHQMDPMLMYKIGEEFIRRFEGEDFNKIVTIEASGIAPAIMVGYIMQLPVVNFLTPDDRFIFIDDFLAFGNAALGIIELAKQAGAHIAGMGFIIEKAFQDGGKLLRDQGIHVESLAVIDSLDNCQIHMR